MRPFIAVADPDPGSPGMVLAGELGLLTFTDYHQLYDPRYSIHLIIILTPDEEILRDILQTRPERIRILSYHVFQIFWKAIGNEERKAAAAQRGDGNHLERDPGFYSGDHPGHVDRGGERVLSSEDGILARARSSAENATRSTTRTNIPASLPTTTAPCKR